METLLEILKFFGVKSEEELFQKKSTERQLKALSAKKPKRVEISQDECRALCKSAGLEYLDGYEERIIEHIISDETCDRYGDIVRAKGIDIKNYKKNPVILFGHDYTEPPIGNAIKVWVDEVENNVKAWGLYLDDRTDKSGRSDLSFKLISSGAMPACSIGFLPLKSNRPSTKEDRVKIGLGEYGVEYLKWELLEYSACSVPANPNALQNMLKEKSLTKKDCHLICDTKLISDDDFDTFLKAVKQLYADFEIIPDDSNEYDLTKKQKETMHVCRLQNPNKYEKCKESLRKSGEKSYIVISGKVKNKDKWEEQSFQYGVDVWSEDEARKHCKSNNGILFEPVGKNVEILRNETIEDAPDDLINAIKDLINGINDLSSYIKNLNVTLEPIFDLKKLSSDSTETGNDNNHDQNGLYNILEGDIKL